MLITSSTRNVHAANDSAKLVSARWDGYEKVMMTYQSLGRGTPADALYRRNACFARSSVLGHIQ